MPSSKLPTETRRSLATLFVFINEGDVESVVRLVKEKPDLVEHNYVGGLSALAKAVLCGQLEVCTALVKLGASLEWRDGCENTLLHVAVRENKLAIIRWICATDKNLYIDARNEDGETAVFLASSSNAVLSCLLEKTEPAAPSPPENVPVELTDLFNFGIQTGSNLILILGQVLNKYMDTALVSAISDKPRLTKRSAPEKLQKAQELLARVQVDMDEMEAVIQEISDVPPTHGNHRVRRQSYNNVIVSTLNTALTSIKAMVNQFSQLTSQYIGMYQVVGEPTN